MHNVWREMQDEKRGVVIACVSNVHILQLLLPKGQYNASKNFGRDGRRTAPPAEVKRGGK
jgi:hypothetical protein